MIDIKNEVLLAQTRIQPYIRYTPLEFSPALSKMTNAQVFLKCENLQYTGAFKVRGAFNKLLSLSPLQRKNGVVAASSGNHGAAVAFGLNKLKIPGQIFVPENASSAKVGNIRNYDVPLTFYATDCMQTEIYATQYAKAHGMTYISPYDDLQVVAGQGTIGIEISQQLDEIDAIFAVVGGGGLISGIAGYIKEHSPYTDIIGCLPENSPVLAESIKAGKIIEIQTQPTLSDATAGGMVQDAITFELCQRYVDDYVLVSEEEIKQAIIGIIKMHRMLIEGASAVALAAFIKNAEQYRGKKIVIILSGANISLETLKSILQM